MATTSKPKDATSNWKKEKTVKTALNSQSAVHSNQAKRSLGSPSIKDQRPSPSPSEKKAIPNYLKPTISSRHESFKLGKKPAQEDGVSKPVLNRRRSFDKPISISRMEKSFDSPGPRERTTHVRPSSSSTKSTVAVTGRPSLLNSRESKSFKYESRSPAVAVKKTLKKTGPGSTCSGDDHSTESEVESKVEKDENEFQTSSQITATEVVVERDVVEQDNEEADNGDYGQIEASEIVVVSEKVNKDENSQEGGEEKLLEDDEAKIADKEDEPEEEGKEIAKVDDASPDCNPDENSAKKAETEDESREEEVQLDDKEDSTKQEKKASEGNEKEEDTDAVSKVVTYYPEEETEISKEGADNEELIISKEGEEAENAEVELSNRLDEEQGRKEREETASATEETKAQTKTVAAESSKRHGKGHGRKDTPAYNDVIEETASKLLEKRKNKVKALVGAFETVIDYESAAK